PVIRGRCFFNQASVRTFFLAAGLAGFDGFGFGLLVDAVPVGGLPRLYDPAFTYARNWFMLSEGVEKLWSIFRPRGTAASLCPTTRSRVTGHLNSLHSSAQSRTYASSWAVDHVSPVPVFSASMPMLRVLDHMVFA